MTIDTIILCSLIYFGIGVVSSLIASSVLGLGKVLVSSVNILEFLLIILFWPYIVFNFIGFFASNFFGERNGN